MSNRYLFLSILACSLLGATGYYVWQHQSFNAEDAFFYGDSKYSVVSYVYAPGVLGTEMVMCRYAPDFVASTGERIRCSKGAFVINEPHSAVIFPEIDTKKPHVFTLNPIKAIVNHFRKVMNPLAHGFMKERYGVTVEDNPDSRDSVVNYAFHLGRANIGQQKDIQALRDTYHKHSELYPDTAVILYGDSRGAATIFSFLALDKPEHVKAAVIEGVFDDLSHVIKHCFYAGKDEQSEQVLHRILSLTARSYKKTGTSPRKNIAEIPHDIPLLLVTSCNDCIVPPQCTFYLYSELKRMGYDKVHLLVLQHASHPAYMLDNECDKELYESVVHAFYKEYGLPYNRAKAYAGTKAFAETQPTVEELQQHYSLPTCELCCC